MSKKKAEDQTVGMDREALIKKFGRSEGDTGSAEVQVALANARIKSITDHLATHPKDFHSRRGLIKLVNGRRRMLDYLKGKSEARYKDVIATLGLRR